MSVLAVDIGGTRIKLAVMQNHALLAQETLEARSHEGLAPQLPRIVRCLEALCARTGVATTECSALAVAFPSLIDPARGRVRTAYGKYADAPELNLSLWSQEALGLPLVIENDARAALLGEWQAGAGRGSRDLVMLTLGTGLGTAALIDGRLVRGKHGQAAVLGGHLMVRPGGAQCTCGNRGCAEAEASTYALPTIAARRADFQASPLHAAPVIDYAAVLRLARDGDPCALGLRSEAIDVWTAVIVNLIHAYDPERVIVGGGIVAGGADFLTDLQEGVRQRAHTPWGEVQLVPAELGDAAALYGGEFLASERSGPLQ